MVNSISIEEYFAMEHDVCLIDVRSEGEFNAGRIPLATNIPILTNEERKIVGTIYKHNGSQTAVLKGLELTGPHLSERLKIALKIVAGRNIVVHCWRGGMRSEFFAFLFHYYGLKPMMIKGGYKAYRTKAHETFSISFNIQVLSGKTGAAKTYILNELEQLGEQVIDIEKLAHHRGSTFGALGMKVQNSQEQFENELFECLRMLDPTRPVWVEDESRNIGSNVIPEGFWKQMRAADRYVVEKDFEERLAIIMKDYGDFSKDDLANSMNKIGKRLGPQHLKAAIEFLTAGEIEQAFKLALVYYDKAYSFQIEKLVNVRKVQVDAHKMSHSDTAKKLVEIANGR
ncbi:MAG: tRNA 2-selenouridine(34) synthase MnmH [Crocinitomicaceae bacterium]|jgi:tRNA 2-selenouridine synthase|nr:tRNA 2-selenouridine(34) synthase MnmH [Crocinitomicaceae bacterium]MDP4867152.1 tRNA 2-selenouridine(34) synthase MnmH [Crocinitomicaceae bacterium]MDP5009679.1 tRNA 2-selenouridine(34) synthase MnmH [Crocinitomicaceae bacterium]